MTTDRRETRIMAREVTASGMKARYREPRGRNQGMEN
jgi:hypothetical protein